MQSAWGDKETQFFYDLTPERILDAVEASGLRCTGRCLTLNSMENRVYEVELEIEGPVANRSDRFRIAKFYRPGRWDEKQILEEHRFLEELQKVEIPAIAAEPFPDGKTLHKMKDCDIWYCLFPKGGGRSPDELDESQLLQVGRLLARLHNVGASRKAKHRIELTPTTYGINNLKYLLDSRSVPITVESQYKKVVEEICKLSEKLFKGVPVQRVHGDCHLGNLLFGREGFFLVDFDDMVRAPCVQDVWLLIPGRDDYAKSQLDALLAGYEQMRDFDRNTLNLIEPLRALRLVHFSAWIARRWQDPIFPRFFVEFGSEKYWQEQLFDLQEQLRLIQNG